MTHATPSDPSPAQVLEDLLGLVGGAVAGLLPFVILAVPSVVLLGLFVLPMIALGAVVVLAGAIVAAVIAPPFLLFRSLRRRRR